MSLDPTREEVDGLSGPLQLEFGASWCPHCQAIQPVLSELLRQYSQVRHIAIEDGPGQPLGRSYHVKLWPTLVFQRNGQVLRQLIRPDGEAIRAAFAELVQ
jgi:thioredoxin 1